ncbi:mediator of RNA polymerase II transcription subunit 19 isoform X2 [Ischnura elegans]|uniref:mediator of RNA polymerase II transcription subunit 19 isoform X2 n=1 Tax=Ischnura elegans TaxID=197161 RepID=UPI001ED88DF5|nr:mediator of RNA polymerase II transcription subunit 19 isoform X2 [Ischnura elegans]
MMAEQFRKVEQYSPKSSPRGARSPVVSRQDSTGTLKTTISLGKNPSIVHSGPFYLMKEPPGESDLTGATNLMAYYGLEHSYSKFSGKKVKEQLSSFLPNLPGMIDAPGNQDNSSLRSVIEKPPIGGKELLPLTSVQLAGFRLHPGPLPEQYRYVNQAPHRKHKKGHKRHKHKIGGDTPGVGTDVSSGGVASGVISGGAGTPGAVVSGTGGGSTPGGGSGGGDIGGSTAGTEVHEKKHKKQKRHDEEKERKKRKKEKKRKKQRHSPEHPGSGSLSAPASNSTSGQHANG